MVEFVQNHPKVVLISQENHKWPAVVPMPASET